MWKCRKYWGTNKAEKGKDYFYAYPASEEALYLLVLKIGKTERRSTHFQPQKDAEREQKSKD